MVKIDRLDGDTGWIDLAFIERERTPRQIIEVDIQLHLAGVSLSNTKQYLERLGVKRSRAAIHIWVQKADLQPAAGANPDHVAVDKTVIQLNNLRFWLYDAVNSKTIESLYVRLFSTLTTDLTKQFFHEMAEKHAVSDAVFLVDGAPCFYTLLLEPHLQFQFVARALSS
jgi:putative transposase